MCARTHKEEGRRIKCYQLKDKKIQITSIYFGLHSPDY